MIHMKKPSTLARKAEPIEYLQRMSDMLGQNMSDGNNDSQSDGDSHSTLDATGKGGNKGGPKRRASRAGTRSVATLSEAQLARKRANDREAQRLIRQRTKDHIEQLERRIQELSGGQGDDGELHELRRRNSELEKELKDLKEIRTLSQASIASSESASRGGRGVTNQAHFAAPTSYPTYMSAVDGSASASPLSVADNSWPPHTSPYGSMSNPPSSRGSFSPHNFQFDTSDMVDSSMGGVLGPSAVDPILADVESDRNWLPTGSSRSSPSVNAIRASIPAQQLQLPQPITSTPFSSQPPVPAWEIPIRTTPPTEPLENILLGVVQQQRNMALSGVTGALITGPYHPSMNMIVYPEQQHLTSHPVSSILSDLLVKTGVPRLPERAAALFSTYHFIQWQIYPSKMTFDALFDWQIPRTSQLLTPHPIWASLMAWGKLRDAVINDQAKYGTEEFQHIYTSSLNLNWPWREIDCFCFEKGGEIRISDEFERHISQLSNWSLDEPFARKYPELESVCKFTKAKSGGSSGAGPMGV